MRTQVKCPVCAEYHDYLVSDYHKELDAPLINFLKAETNTWEQEMGACTRCLDQAHIAFAQCFFESQDTVAVINGYKIFPTPIRLLANTQLTGRGVTICFIDSGFYRHPDLIYPENRILVQLDITQPLDNGYRELPNDNVQPSNGMWHGTMTSVVGAGNGHLSGGLYRGIASQSKLVQLKVMDEQGRINGEHIAKAIDWAVANKKQYGIRIINISVSDDNTEPWMVNEVDKAILRALARGIIVVVAAGNDPNAKFQAPANSPHAITVGGLDDRNTLDPLLNTMYHSTYGNTSDHFHKPDIIAPAIWLATPILPGTKEHLEAKVLFNLASASDEAIGAILSNSIVSTQLDKQLLFASGAAIREAVKQRIGETRFISPHYKHADGTSFAAPIVCSVIAQMLEANPKLDPIMVREILFVTARKLAGERAGRQGWGAIHPTHAVQMAAGKPLTSPGFITPIIDYSRRIVEFYLYNESASEVSLTGDFNNWLPDKLPLHSKDNHGEWTTALPFTQSGVYRYKYVIDKIEWAADPRNLYKEEDGMDGFNSLLIIP